MLISHRLTRSSRQTIAFACNDYGLELLSDQPIVKHQKELREALSLNRLEDDVLASLNASQVSRRRFKEIAVISGLQFQPKDGTNARHLRTHSGLLFDVFSDHDPDHILFRQAIEEVLADQLEIAAMQAAWCWETPSNYTPLSFPLVVDRLREVLSSEELESRIQRMVIKA
jgi:ATP-dependent Lhr-like helicase